MRMGYVAAAGLLTLGFAASARNAVTRRHVEVKRSGYGAPAVPGSRGRATTLLVLGESGGFGGLDRQTVIRLVGRVVRPGEVVKARTERDVQVAGPVMRSLEKAVRDSGFMSLSSRYAGEPVPDGMTRTIRVTMLGKTKLVSVADGATAPEAFETVWKAASDAMSARGSVIHPADQASP